MIFALPLLFVIFTIFGVCCSMEYWDALFCVGLDRRCTAVHTCLCVFLYMWCQANLETGIQDPSKKTWRQEHTMCLVMGHCVFISLPSTTTNFPASHYYYEASHFAASFAVCCSTILYYMPVFGTLCLPHVLNDKGCKCKCKVGSCPKLSCCFLCFLERERERERERRDIALECWKLLPLLNVFN